MNDDMIKYKDLPIGIMFKFENQVFIKTENKRPERLISDLITVIYPEEDSFVSVIESDMIR